MPSVVQLLEHIGFHQGVGPDFYLPQAHPHVHLRVNNAAAIFQSLAEVRPEIIFISLSWGGQVGAPATVELYSRNFAERLEQRGRYNIHKKQRFEAALHAQIGLAVALEMQLALNLLTGMGIDL